jgi:hypothetical protein
MTTYNFRFYLQNRLIQTGQTGGQLYSDTSPLVFPIQAMQLTNIVPNFLIPSQARSHSTNQVSSHFFTPSQAPSH